MSSEGPEKDASEKTRILPKYYKAEIAEGSSQSQVPQLIQRRQWVCCAVCLGVAGVLAVGLALGLGLGLGLSSSSLPQSITSSDLMDLMTELQNTTASFPNGSRSVLHGYNTSAEWLMGKLTDYGYEPTRQNFSVAVWEEVDPGSAVFTAAVSMEPALNITFSENAQFSVMRYSGSCTGDTSTCLGTLKNVTGGCEGGDFADVDDGDAVLMQLFNEECSLYERAKNAAGAGAYAVVFMRNSSESGLPPPYSRVYGTEPDQTVSIPTIGATYQLGQELLNMMDAGTVNVQIEAQTSVTIADTFNVFAKTVAGKNDSIIVVGSHLDSVPAGPGMNDNGSGTIANLDIAIQMSRLKLKPVNQVMFAFWGAEELGLLGSKFYVSNLSEQERKSIALNLNYDMLASPNFQRAIYNGSDANDSISAEAETIQYLFQEYFDSEKLSSEFTPFTGRSDYGPFIEVGIPAGGLFSGAEQLKSGEQWELFGGLQNAPLDPCYHQSCDTINNTDADVFEQMAKSAAYALQTLMMEENLKECLQQGS